MYYKHPYDEIIELEFLYFNLFNHMKKDEIATEYFILVMKHLEEFKEDLNKIPEEKLSFVTAGLLRVYKKDKEKIKEYINKKIAEDKESVALKK